MRLFAALLVIAALHPVHAEVTEVESVAIEWESGTLTATLTREVDERGSVDAVSRARRAIERDMPDLMIEVLGAVQLDSAGTVADRIDQEEFRVSGLAEAASTARPIVASSTPDLRTARVSFRINLYDSVSPIFIDHQMPIEMDGVLGWQPAPEYTGILVIADEELPQFGEQDKALVEPALMPGLYFAGGSPSLLYRIAESDYYPPATLTGSGPVLYADDFQSTAVLERVGVRPLRILARGVFGDSPTDLVLSEADARVILGSDHLKELLRSGRVSIIISEARLQG